MKDKYTDDINSYWGGLWLKNRNGLDITDPMTIFKFKYFLKPIIDELPVGTKVCEVGSGNCQWLLLIKAYRPDLKLFGIDLSDVAQTIGLELGIEMIQCDVRNIPIRDDSFDFVYSWGVIEHMPEYEQAFKEHYRISKKFIALDVPYKYSIPTIRNIFRLKKQKTSEYDIMIQHGLVFSRTAFLSLVKNVTCKNDIFKIINNYMLLLDRFRFIDVGMPDFIRKKFGHNIGVIIKKG